MHAGRRWCTVALVTGCSLVAAAPAHGQTTRFVDADAPGPADGLTWATALANPQDALGAASATDTIRVADPDLRDPAANKTGRKLRRHERTGRPLGDENFLTNLEGLLERVRKPRKPGRKPKKQEKQVLYHPITRLLG